MNGEFGIRNTESFDCGFGIAGYALRVVDDNHLNELNDLNDHNHSNLSYEIYEVTARRISLGRSKPSKGWITHEQTGK